MQNTHNLIHNMSYRLPSSAGNSAKNLPEAKIPEVHRFQAKDPISALTHFIGFLMAILATPLLLIRGSHCGLNLTSLISLGIFMISMILLYGASASYHAFQLDEVRNRRLKRLDHMSIFVLIAGSYTPVCLIVLPVKSGLPLLITVWSVALVGILFKYFWVGCPKWVSSVIYIGMGWLCISQLPTIMSILPKSGFLWLLSGGLLYTVGGVIYALKLNLIPKNRIGFGNHDLFHLFVMAGSFCHYMLAFTALCTLE